MPAQHHTPTLERTRMPTHSLVRTRMPHTPSRARRVQNVCARTHTHTPTDAILSFLISVIGEEVQWFIPNHSIARLWIGIGSLCMS